MAGAAESRGGDGIQLDGIAVNFLLPERFFTGFEIGICGDGFLQDGIAFRAEDGVIDIAFDDGGAAADLAIVAIHTMTDDAGDAFDRSWVASEIAGEEGLLALHTDLGMTADAKVTVGAGGLLQRGLE